MPPAAIQQVPLDRVTQTIYARIHAAMKPLRDEMARVQEPGELLASALGKFRESLPALDLSTYNALRNQLGQVADALHDAVHVPFSTSTRTLAAQLIDHDLPRLAAIAVKLNEEDAPKFFAAINYTDSTFETFAVDAKQKTTIRKADFDAAIEEIVNRRLSELGRLVKEDMAKWVTAQGAGENIVVAEPAAGQHHMIRVEEALRELVHVEQGADGVIHFHLDAGEVWSFMPESSMKAPALARVEAIGRSQSSQFNAFLMQTS